MTFNSSINEDVTRTRINRLVVPGKRRNGRKKQKKQKRFHIVINNKRKGIYAETDLDKGTITVNKKRHKTNPEHKRRYPELLNTKIHEFMHVRHPKMLERTVRKRTNRLVTRMGRKQKSRIYSTHNIYQVEHDTR